MHTRSHSIQLLLPEQKYSINKHLTAQGLYFFATGSGNNMTAKQDSRGTTAIPLLPPLYFHQYPTYTTNAEDTN